MVAPAARWGRLRRERDPQPLPTGRFAEPARVTRTRLVRNGQRGENRLTARWWISRIGGHVTRAHARRRGRHRCRPRTSVARVAVSAVGGAPDRARRRRRAPTTPSTDSVTTWRCGCRASTGPSRASPRSGAGSRSSRPNCPCPSRFRSRSGSRKASSLIQWEVVRWLPGELATLDRLDEPIRAARELAEFVRSASADRSDGRPAASTRAADPQRPTRCVRQGVEGLRGEVDGDAVLDAWSRVMDAPDHDGPPVWFHGDLAHLNLLARAGRLSAVIDWGTCGVGDPAIDTIVAWNLFTGDARDGVPRRARYRRRDVAPRQGLGAHRRVRNPVLPRHEPLARRQRRACRRRGPRR